MLRRSALLRSTLGLSFARGVSGLLLVGATVVLARGAGKQELGLFGLALVVGMYASVVADSGRSQCWPSPPARSSASRFATADCASSGSPAGTHAHRFVH